MTPKNNIFDTVSIYSMIYVIFGLKRSHSMHSISEVTKDLTEQKNGSFVSNHTSATEDGQVLLQSSVSIGGHTAAGTEGEEEEEETAKGNWFQYFMDYLGSF